MARSVPLVCILLLIFGWQQQPTNAHPLLSVQVVFKFAFTLLGNFNKINSLFKGENTKDEFTAIDTKVFDKLNSISYNISYNIEDLKTEMRYEFSKLDTKLSTKTNQLFDYFDNVEFLYNEYLKYRDNPSQWDRSTLNDFVKKATSNDFYALRQTLVNMHRKLTETDINGDSIFSILTDNVNTELICIRNQSPQQLIVGLYNTVVQKETNGLIIQLFAYKLVEEWRKNEQDHPSTTDIFVSEKEVALNEFHVRIINTFNKMKSFMVIASRELWKCDPRKHQQDLTFSKIQVFQSYINFKKDFKRFTLCDMRCSMRENDRSACSYPFCRREPEEKRCSGQMRNCIEINGPSNLCYSPKDSDRRYEWLETEDEDKYGRIKKCSNTITVLHPEKAPWPEPGSLCGFCLCTCVNDREQIDRYISLNEALSNTYNNMVVTGVRFIKKNHILYIQIQEGHLEANGSINRETVDWKPMPIEDSNKSINEFGENLYIVNGDQNTVYLDEIDPRPQSPKKNEIVTGLRFTKVGNDLKLEIERTAFDFATGQLKGRSIWYSNKATREQRTAVELKDSDVPILMNNNKANSKSNQYVQFQITGHEKDFGQNTIPFIDLQEIVTQPPTPISGAGVFHKARDNSGGFLALKLMHYDYSPHVGNNN